MHVIATAGHVDHGKSTLVKALTSIDPDRLAEEKARGLTIDLGFAWTTLASGRGVSFIDVPGHVRFIKNMLAGVGAVDACLFVVAATEGWKPQSEEHLRILELLGISHGIVALTQASLVDDDLAELARLDVDEHLSGTFLDGAPIVEVDSIDGTGIDELRIALDELTASAPTALDKERPRLWIDRVFSAKGSGTVVTGTLVGGVISVDDDLMIEPQTQTTRVRAIQSQGAEHESIGPGHRVALNLSGVDRTDVNRGDVVVRPDQWHRTRQVDAQLNVLDRVDHDVSRRGAYAMYLGSGEFPVRMRVLGPTALLPGDTGSVRLHLNTYLPLLPGDHFVLREFGRDETIGGGEILDVDPRLSAAKTKPDRDIARVVGERGWVRADILERLTGVEPDETLNGWVVDPAALRSMRDSVHDAIESAGPLGLDTAPLDDRERAVLSTLDDVVIDAGFARLGEAPDPLADHPVVAMLETNPLAPPDPEGYSNDELRALVQRGLIVQVDGRYFAASAVDLAAQQVAELLAEFPEGVTVSQIRDKFSTTRKFALPLLARLDSTGVTRRRGDLRLGGPRLPRV